MKYWAPFLPICLDYVDLFLQKNITSFAPCAAAGYVETEQRTHMKIRNIWLNLCVINYIRIVINYNIIRQNSNLY